MPKTYNWGGGSLNAESVAKKTLPEFLASNSAKGFESHYSGQKLIDVMTESYNKCVEMCPPPALVVTPDPPAATKKNTPPPPSAKAATSSEGAE